MEKITKFLTSSEFQESMVYIAIGIVINLIIGKIIYLVLNRHKGISHKDKRKDMVIKLTKNISKYVILVFVILSVLKVYGIDTTNIMTSLGIFAAITGLAFQSLVRDVIAGASIIVDNKYAVGDFVEINGFKGFVTSFGLKTTKLKAWSGEVKSIDNASFTEVTNYSVANCDIYLKLNVAYNTDIDKLEEVLTSMKQDILSITDVLDYKLLGVEELAESGMVYEILITCKPVADYHVKREAYKMFKQRFDKEKISIPYNTFDVNLIKTKS